LYNLNHTISYGCANPDASLSRLDSPACLVSLHLEPVRMQNQAVHSRQTQCCKKPATILSLQVFAVSRQMHAATCAALLNQYVPLKHATVAGCGDTVCCTATMHMHCDMLLLQTCHICSAVDNTIACLVLFADHCMFGKQDIRQILPETLIVDVVCHMLFCLLLHRLRFSPASPQLPGIE